MWSIEKDTVKKLERRLGHLGEKLPRWYRYSFHEDYGPGMRKRWNVDDI
jgi:hypothetical protein